MESIIEERLAPPIQITEFEKGIEFSQEECVTISKVKEYVDTKVSDIEERIKEMLDTEQTIHVRHKTSNWDKTLIVIFIMYLIVLVITLL